MVWLIYQDAVTEPVEGRCTVLQQGGAVLTLDVVLLPGAVLHDEVPVFRVVNVGE